MSEDITKELPKSTEDKLDQLFLLTRNIIQGLNQLDARMTTLEEAMVSLKAGTNPFWQAMHDQQQQILTLVQEQSRRMDGLEARMDGLEARMDGLEAQIARLDEKIDTGLRKISDKFELLLEDTLEWRADVRDLKRRVTRLEPIS